MRSLLLVFCAILLSFSSFAVLPPISSPSNVCGGNNLIMTNSVPGGTWSVSSSAMGSITWTTGTTSSAVFAAASVSTAGAVTITYTLGTDEVYKYVTVHPTPAAISGPPAFCNGYGFITFTDATPGGAWSCGVSGLDSITTGGVLYHIPPYATAYAGIDTITYTMPTGCAVTRGLTVNPITGGYMPPNVCAGGSSVTAIGTPSGGTWSGSAPGVAIVTMSGTIIPVSLGTVILTYTLLGCTMTNAGSPTVVSYGVSNHYTSNIADTTCSSPDFFISACGFSSMFNVTTYFGDGTHSSTSFGGTTSAHVYHSYSYPGTYSVRQYLYDGSTLIDSAIFSYEYMYCKMLPIKLYVDKNHNCIKDGTDHFSYMPVTIRIDSNGVPIDTMTATSGIYYKATGPAGTIYAFRVLNTPAGMNQSCPSSGVLYDTIVATVNTYTAKYFGMECTSSFDYDLAQNSSAQCGRHAFMSNIQITNSYGTIINPVIKVNFSPKYHYVNSYPTPTSITGNTLTWNFDTVCALQPIPHYINLSLNVPGTWLTPGDTVHTSIESMPFTGDVNPGNNNTDRVDTVKSSWDPNEISVYPSGTIASGTQVQYTVVFENDGNDTAQNIYVLDTLSDYLDINTLRMVTATATMNIAVMKNSGGYNVVKFDFPNIMLPDSTHHNECNGMFMFNIKTKNGLPDGTLIPNRVGIYFDDNEVVMTNTATDVIGAIPPLAVTDMGKTANVTLYPNPVTAELTIKMDNGAYSTYTITNSIGQVLMQQPISNTQTKVDVKMLPAGLYYVTMKGENGSAVKKFVKE